MFLMRLKHLTDQALSHVREGDVLECQQGRTPGPRPGHAFERPELRVSTEKSTFNAVLQIPGATPSNTLVCWDPEARTLSVLVARSSGAENISDWYAELRLPADVEGSKSRCLLKDGVLRVRAPHEDTPASTGLALLAAFSEQGALSSLPCGA